MSKLIDVIKNQVIRFKARDGGDDVVYHRDVHAVNQNGDGSQHGLTSVYDYSYLVDRPSKNDDWAVRR